MSNTQIQSVLQQMQGVAHQAGGAEKGARVDTSVGGGGFTDALQASVQRINDLQMASAETGKAFQAGEPGLELHEVMVESQKAGVAFEMGVQMRNRLVTAYKDVMNMQV